jgi:hypothetical protein
VRFTVLGIPAGLLEVVLVCFGVGAFLRVAWDPVLVLVVAEGVLAEWWSLQAFRAYSG